eukprot:TRINITY_DN2230_c2_g1_i1.p1 TRINITY_DN2230_c2_g1~~TRINITY_DN2230_c2_g1_i1.p1  ORF type:complete len:454 (+),score=58.64 TRINITY_DN2230_c2_g1_i1:58-1419(+)
MLLFVRLITFSCAFLSGFTSSAGQLSGQCGLDGCFDDESDASAMMQMQSSRGSRGVHEAQKDAKTGISKDDEYPIVGRLKLKDFRGDPTTGCYDRANRNQWSVTDVHIHVRPFGGPPVPMAEQIKRFQNAGVLFPVLYGIGQRLPIDSNCTYYLACPGTPVKPSMKNDFWVAQSFLDNVDLISDDYGPEFTFSMSFPDLHKPETIVPKMDLLEQEYPGMFKWMGELNVAKQALFKNRDAKTPPGKAPSDPVSIRAIDQWGPFMEELRKRDMPIGLHSDLGHDNKTDSIGYLENMDEILEKYPKNKIIWLHLGGLSLQLHPRAKASLAQVDYIYVTRHVKILKERLKKYPNLMIDLSWDVLYKSVFSDPKERQPYVDLINEFPTRFLAGTDHVAAIVKDEQTYRDELNRTSFINTFMNDEAFRRIALGQNFFDFRGINFTAPKVCKRSHAPSER